MFFHKFLYYCSIKKLLLILLFLPLFSLAQLNCSVTGTDINCCNGSDGTLSLTVTGGTQPYTYNWTGPGGYSSISANLFGLYAGTYSVLVTDVNGTTTSCIYTLTEPSCYSIFSTQTNVSCNGGNSGSINLTVTGATPPYTYLWSNGATTQGLSNISSGWYNCIITDANCSDTIVTFIITEPTQLVCSMTGVAPTGGLSNGSIDLTVTGATPPYTYLWSNGATTQDLSNISSGWYNCIITDANGCITTCSMSFVGPNMILADFSANIVCELDTTQFIDLSAGGTSPFIYFWDFGDGTTSVSQNPSHVYTMCGTYNASLIVTDANGLSDTATNLVFIHCPPVAIFNAPIVCEGDCTNFSDLSVSSSSGVIVSWNWDMGGSGLYSFGTLNTYQNPIFCYDNCGSYIASLIVTDDNGCQDSISQVVDIYCLPIADFIWSPDTPCVGLPTCFTDVSVAGSGTIFSSTWDINGVIVSSTPTLTYSFMTPGLHTVTLTVTDINGCISYLSQIVDVNTCNTSCTSTGLDNYLTSKNLLKVTDILGRDIKPEQNKILFYIYNDGTVEKKIIIE